MKTLVAYFSCSGKTKIKAELIANAIGADLHEIVPADPYTKEDLDWMNPRSRTSIEMDDVYARPEIAKFIPNMDEYDKIFVGFPIWWYTAPCIVQTFLESYNMEGKTIIPFATSGTSPYGKCNVRLARSIPKTATLKDGILTSFISDEEVLKWAKSNI